MASDTEPTAADIPGTSAKDGIEVAAATITRMATDMAKMVGYAKEIGKAFKELKEAGKALQQGTTTPGAGNTGSGTPTAAAGSMATITVGGGARPDVFAEGGVGKPAQFTGFVPNAGGQGGTTGIPPGGFGGAPAGNAATPGSLTNVAAQSGAPTATASTAGQPTATAGTANAGSAMSGGTVAAATPTGGPSGNAPVGGGIGGGGGGMGGGSMGAGAPTAGSAAEMDPGNAPVQTMVGSGQGSEEGGGGFGAISMVMKGAKFLGGAAMAAVNDLRFDRGEALRYERNRLIAFGGTGDFTRFQDNLKTAINPINVQNRAMMEEDLAQAYGGYYAQGMGGGQGGEIRTARTVGTMHTLANIAGIDPSKVGSATDSMYSSQAFYKAMATGIMTRDPTTGDMMTSDEIVNQYRGRFKGNTPDQIRRALAPGGAFAAELNQTWGDSGLAEMISEGILATSITGKAIEPGKIADLVGTEHDGAGYAGSKWTRGRDSETRRLAAEERRLASYVDSITHGIEMANSAVTAINELLTAMPAPMRQVVESIEFMGGALDTFNTTMPQSTAKMIEAIEGVVSKIAGWLTGGLVSDVIGGVLPGASEGDWFVNKDQPMNIHQGEMILPKRVATAVRSELQMGRTTADTPSTTHNLPGPRRGTGTSASVNIYVTVQNASDAETMNFARKVKGILETDNELLSIGTGQFG